MLTPSAMFCSLEMPDVLQLSVKLETLFFRGNTKLEHGNFVLNDQMDQQEAVLEKFAFSNALCLSGKSLCSEVSCCVLCSTSHVVSLSSSETGDMGGFIRQLCRINSNNSRGTVNTSEETTRKKKKNGSSVLTHGSHLFFPSDAKVWQES